MVLGAGTTILAVAGLVLVVVGTGGSASHEVGVALISGGLTGLAFSLATYALAVESDRQRVILQLSGSQDLEGVVLRGQRIREIALVGKHMPIADLSNGAFRDGRFVGADLTWSTFEQSDLSGSRFDYAVLDDANLRGATLVDVSFRCASLREAALEGATIDGLDLRGADLTEVDLNRVSLRRVLHDDSTTWPAGYVPPESTPALAEAFSRGPNWGRYWERFGRKV